MLRHFQNATARKALQRRGVTSSAAIRDSFLNYFQENGHVEVPSSPLIPANDPSLLFTNAGMVQFKDKFLDPDSEFKKLGNFSRACSAQRCLRAGGKHNDLENVGYTPRHHTFFEMLGNFSFGDYFKEEAIHHAWTFLTKNLGLPPQHLLVTVLEGDEEARALWRKISGLPDGRIVELDKSENFWSMGDGPGPCGPCSEIFWDQNVSLPTRSVRDVEGDHNWLEVWNLVFMQYQGGEDGAPLRPLERKSVDTGMGLERMASVLQGVDNNFQIDSFRGLLGIMDEFTRRHGRPLASDVAQETIAKQVVVDHARAAAFLLADGVFPANTGRGYVLRRIIRRATRYSFLLAGGNNTNNTKAQHHATQALLDGPSLAQLVPELVKQFGGRYPELAVHSEMIKSVLKNEEQAFAKTIAQGTSMFHQTCEEIRQKSGPGDFVDGVMRFPPEAAFKLYDTCGFPVDLTARLVEECGWSLELSEVDNLMDHQRERARLSWKGADGNGNGSFAGPSGNSDAANGPDLEIPTAVRQWESTLPQQPTFLNSDSSLFGAEPTSATECKVLAVHENQYGRGAWISLDPCPFYARGGGQAGDVGVLRWTDPARKREQSALVVATERPYRDGIALLVDFQGETGASDSVDDGCARSLGSLLEGTTVRARVDQNHRAACSIHHSATHLLNAALREMLGPHVLQAGSSVTDTGLTFDFTHSTALTEDELCNIEHRINAMTSGEVFAAADRGSECTYALAAAAAAPTTEVSITEMPIEEARATGALGNFSEKYGDVVRVVRMGGEDGSFSAELCGGTHVSDIREVFPFKILRERSVASGTRRIEAVAGRASSLWLLLQHRVLADTMRELGAARTEDISSRITALRQPATDARALMRMFTQAPAEPNVVVDVDGASLNAAGDGPLKVCIHTLDLSDARDSTVALLSSKKASQLLAKRAKQASASAPDCAHVLLLQGAAVCVSDKAGNVDATALLDRLTKSFGGRGGGSAKMCRGSLATVPTDANVVAAAFAE